MKQDLVLNTEINDANKIHIDGQLIGELKGLKFLIELTSKTLDTDIKSIKKAARRGVKEELEKRMAEIIDQYAPILEGVEEKDLKAKVKEKQKEIRLNPKEKEKSKKTKPLQPLKKITDDTDPDSTSTSS